MRRICIITDSLGCARPDQGVSVGDTWPELLMRELKDNVYYTFLHPGLSVKDINTQFIEEFEPDIIIVQYGIVDACRRALSRKELFVLSHMPVLGKAVKSYCKKKHYKITKRRNIHYADIIDMVNITETLASIAGSHICFVAISKPGKFLLDSTYNIEKDVKNYNNAVVSLEAIKIQYIDPYLGHNPEEYLLADGHHLTSYGNRIVFEALKSHLYEV